MPTAHTPILLGLLAALTWGGADFAGGLAARRAPVGMVVLLAHGSSVLALGALIVATAAATLPSAAFPVAILSGVTGGIGLIAFYRALAIGAMGLTAALAGLLTAAVPVVAGLATQGRPAPLQSAGFAAAAAAIALIAWAPAATAAEIAAAATGDAQRASRRTLSLAAVAGFGFGTQLLLLHAATAFGGSPLRALMLSRMGGAGLAALSVALGGRRARAAGDRQAMVASDPSGVAADAVRRVGDDSPGRRLLAGHAGPFALLILLTGLLDTTGNGLYMLSALAGRLDVAAMLSSLYPGVTILLAAALLRERTTRMQALGMALALVAVGLISAG